MLGGIYQLHDRPWYIVATATTRYVPAAATQTAKDFEFEYFCDSHETEGNYGLQEARFLYSEISCSLQA